MAAGNLVIDTGIFIEYLRVKDKTRAVLYNIPDEINLFISSVTLYELYMGATTDDKRKDIQILIEDVAVLPLNDEVAIKAADIYHDLKKANQIIDFRDIFIAATCVVYNFPLKTINTKHFNRIAEVTLL